MTADQHGVTAAIVVLAKAPVAGRSKTRLCPQCSPEEAAELAAAALADTLRTVAATPAARRFLVLEGRPGPWVPEEIAVRQQRGHGLEERLAAAFADVGGPTLLIGMDTPQVSCALLSDALAVLGRTDVDAVLGPTLDGGYWTIGLRSPNDEVFRGIAMSRPDTCELQRERLRRLGLRTVELEVLRDVDRMEDAHAVAHMIPASHFAATLGAMAAAA